ncbi:hypothetical protein MNV49_004123 [Pseudohyphozyma bogoriensis]|nr:hypothetical protein MNV49_004123 [Pseudohyphozyma bogoriensis]
MSSTAAPTPIGSAGTTTSSLSSAAPTASAGRTVELMGKWSSRSAPAAAPAPGLATTAAPLGASTATGATPGQPAAITKRTKLEELPAAAKSLIEQIDAGIRAQVGMCEELKGRDLGAGITATGDKYLAVLSESTTTTTLLTTDSRTVADLKQSLEVDLEDVNKFVKIVEGYKNPNKDGAGAAAKSVAGFPFEYFERKLKEFKEKLARYRGVMDQIQQLLESSHSASSPAAILPTLRAQHASFMSLASLIATLTSELERVKDDYRLIWRAKTGSVVDPFRLAGSGSNGVDGVTRGVGGLGVAR